MRVPRYKYILHYNLFEELCVIDLFINMYISRLRVRCWVAGVLGGAVGLGVYLGGCWLVGCEVQGPGYRYKFKT